VLAPWRPAGTSASLVAALAADGVAVAPCRFVPEALRVVSGVPQHTRAFGDGAFWIQDEASQLVVAAFGETVGPYALDACAAPGGKALGLALRLSQPGLVVAADRHAKRLSRLTQNVRRLDTKNIVALAADMSRPAPLTRAFDDVLVDAPCSGTGTLRRHPEIRWRLTPDQFPVLAKRQQAILSASAALVRTGGRLAYSVCSIEPEEGEAVIEAFLANHREFTRMDPRSGLTETAQVCVGDDLALRTGPLDDAMDGFYAAFLTRRSN
jgi:16S rRNA (cytosine967-C5)-methyltransferase